MGVYAMVGKENLQIKSVDIDIYDDNCKSHYDVLDEIELNDGVHICYDGWFVVQNGIIHCSGTDAYDKWGGELNCREIISGENPINKALGIK